MSKSSIFKLILNVYVSFLADLKSLKLYVAGDFKLGDVRTKNYLSQLSGWGALDHLPGFKVQFVLPQDLVLDGNLNEGKPLDFLKKM